MHNLSKEIFIYFTVLSFFLVSYGIFSVAIVTAATTNPNIIEIPNPLKVDSVLDVINSIINWLFKISLVVSPLMIVVAGYFFVFSGGDTTKVIQARQIIIYTLIGLLIIFTSRGIIELLKRIIGEE